MQYPPTIYFRNVWRHKSLRTSVETQEFKRYDVGGRGKKEGCVFQSKRTINY